MRKLIALQILRALLLPLSIASAPKYDLVESAQQIPEEFKSITFREMEWQLSGHLFDKKVKAFYEEEEVRYHHTWASIRTLKAKHPSKIHIAATIEEALKDPDSFFEFEFGIMNHGHLNELCQRNRDVYEKLEGQESGACRG